MSWGCLVGLPPQLPSPRFQAGRNAERVENMRPAIEVQRDQLEAASRRPRDRGELASRMRDGTF
jgi:hypothetical protein